MTRLACFALAVAAMATASYAMNCNDMHIIGVTAVNNQGTPQGVFDKMLGEQLCVRVQLIEIDTDGLPETPLDYDVRVTIVNSLGVTVQTCCWTGAVSPGNAIPFYMGPATGWTCCYQLSPPDPIGTYTINVEIFANDANCTVPCTPGSWNHTVAQVTGVVPVELSSFEASVSGRSVLIRWETASEQDNLGFFVLRATERDGDYVRLGDMIPARGTSSTGAAYSFVDTPPAAGVYYYRLEDVATNGNSTIHDPVRVVVGETSSWGGVKAAFDK